MQEFNRYLSYIILVITIALVWLIFPLNNSYAQEYYFQEEFNNDRPHNTLDPEKWILYPNTETNFGTIREFSGFLVLNQQNNTSRFPLIVSKNPVLPTGDFVTEVSFRYSRATFWGDGFGFSDRPLNYPETSTNTFFNVSLWMDKTVASMRIFFKDTIIYEAPVNLSNHVFKINKVNKKYLLFLDGQLIFTSPEVNEQIRYFWAGNPFPSNYSIPEWTRLSFDYIRTTALDNHYGPEPFLRLPWDYESEGLTFNEAAMGMSSYLDHEYPLLSESSLSDLDPKDTMIIYNSPIRTTEQYYSNHDGYDYGKVARAIIGKPAVASADGIATFLGSCSACGNAVLIDHQNGYQTRYYHLDTVTNTLKDSPTPILKGQKVGTIGYTGRVYPKGPDGAHLHFMVVQDKNNDGNFEDNIPDGITDPYGWQSNEPDPWESFSFFYNGQQRTGNKSYYLWDQQLANLDATLDSNGGVFNTERFELKFPQDFTQENLQLKMEAQPQIKGPDNLVSIGSTIKTTLTDAAGNVKDQFNAFYELIIEYEAEDMFVVNPLTLSIYSSEDGLTWRKEGTLIDVINSTATAKLDHMTYFALMAERKDTLPPISEAIIEGENGIENWYRSDVKVTIEAKDNENGLGVEYTFYRIGSQEWKLYESPLSFTEEGNYRVEFYSIDKDENTELPRILEFSIDKTNPEVKIFADQEQFDLTLEAVDQNQTSIDVISLNKKNQKQYVIKDLAENTLTLWVKYKDKEKKDDFQIEQISYNNNPAIELDKNSFKFSYKKRKESPRLEKQSFDSEDKRKKPEIKLEYNFEKDQTKIEERINGKKVKQTIPGFKLLQVTTNKGTLEYSY